MIIRRHSAFLASLGLLVGTAVLCDAQGPAPKQNKRLRGEAADKIDFEIVCGSCHAPGMVSDIRTEPDWKETVEQMVSIGATGTPAQMEAVTRFLLRTQTKVNVNMATAGQMPLVLDISDATAQAIVRHRTKYGPFKTLDDLKKVPGVNASKLDARKDRVAF